MLTEIVETRPHLVFLCTTRRSTSIALVSAASEAHLMHTFHMPIQIIVGAKALGTVLMVTPIRPGMSKHMLSE